MPPPRMSESQLLHAVLELAAALGYLCYHPRPARAADGWRTAAQGNGAAGFPDLVLAGRGRVLFAELKADRGVLSHEQTTWLEQISDAAEYSARLGWYVWRPEHWLNGEIERELRGQGSSEATVPVASESGKA